MLKLTKYAIETINGDKESLTATGYQYLADVFINFVDENLGGLVTGYVIQNIIGYGPIEDLTPQETAAHYLKLGYAIDENGSLVGIENNA